MTRARPPGPDSEDFGSGNKVRTTILVNSKV